MTTSKSPEILELVATLTNGWSVPTGAKAGLERWARLLAQKRKDMRRSDADFQAFISTNDAFRAYLEGVLDGTGLDNLSEDGISALKHALEAHFTKEQA